MICARPRTLKGDLFGPELRVMNTGTSFITVSTKFCHSLGVSNTIQWIGRTKFGVGIDRRGDLAYPSRIRTSDVEK